MKGMRVVLAIALLVTTLLVGAIGVSADEWTSGIMVQNLDDSEAADITIEFYWAEGEGPVGAPAPVKTYPFTLAADEARGFSLESEATFPDMPEGFVGSAVVKSNKPIAANLNTQVPAMEGQVFAGHDPSYPNRLGTASGVLTDEAYDTLYFTQLLKALAGWDSYVAIQNTSPDTDADITLTYYDTADGSVVTAATETVTVSPNTTYIADQGDNAGLPDAGMYSLKVTSTQPLAGIANFYQDASDYTKAKFHSYNAAGMGATTVYGPRILTNYGGYVGGIQIQNVGSVATDLTCTFTFNGTDYGHTITGLAAGASTGFVLDPASTACPPTIQAANVLNVQGSFKIESSAAPIVATVNESNDSIGWGCTYNALPAGSGGSSIMFPQVLNRVAGLSGGVQVFNESATDAPVVVTVSQSGVFDGTITATIPAGGSQAWFLPNTTVDGGASIPAGFNGSVTVVATGGQSLMGIANGGYFQTTNPEDGWAANYGDSMLVYNAIVQ